MVVYKIYGLASSNNPELIRYVGLTSKTIQERCRKHINDSQSNEPTHKRSWIKSELGRGNKIFPILLEDNIKTFKDAADREKQHINELKSRGLNLVNMTEGGDGCPMPGNRKGCRLTEEHKSKISKAHIGIRPTEETRRKMSLRMKGQKLSNKRLEQLRTPVVGVNIITGELYKYNSIVEAAIGVGMTRNLLYSYIRRRKVTKNNILFIKQK